MVNCAALKKLYSFLKGIRRKNNVDAISCTWLHYIVYGIPETDTVLKHVLCNNHSFWMGNKFSKSSFQIPGNPVFLTSQIQFTTIELYITVRYVSKHLYESLNWDDSLPYINTFKNT